MDAPAVRGLPELERVVKQSRRAAALVIAAAAAALAGYLRAGGDTAVGLAAALAVLIGLAGLRRSAAAARRALAAYRAGSPVACRLTLVAEPWTDTTDYRAEADCGPAGAWTSPLAPPFWDVSAALGRELPAQAYLDPARGPVLYALPGGLLWASRASARR